MLRRSCLLLGIGLLVFLTAGTVDASPGPIPQHSDAAWQAAYWNNVAMSGEPALIRAEANLDWDWGAGSPDPSVQADRFSARWQRYLDLAAGTYRFTASSDDGIRVYVDNRRIIDQWNDHAVQTFTADVELAAGHHQVIVEYYENGGMAVAKVALQPISGFFQNWRGEYFDNRHLYGTPRFTRDDASVNFDWGYGSPDGRLPSDGFSVRWSRKINFDPGNYRFTTTTDDGVRLWVNGHLLIDRWHDQAETSYSGTIFLSGEVHLTMQYYENGGLAVAKLSWSRNGADPPSHPRPSNGTVVVNDGDAGFLTGGSSAGWRAAGEGYNGQLTWTRNNDWRRSNYNWARWYPELAPDRYEAYVYIPLRYSTTTNARYWVSHLDGYTLRTIDQSANGGRWVSLGTYRFQGNSRDYVSLSDVTGEPYLSRLIAFDAVKWEPR